MRFILYALLAIFISVPSGFADSTSGAGPTELTFLNWSEYMDPALIESFEKEYNVDVKELFFETDETKEEMILASGGKGFDVVLSSGMPVSSYIKQGWLAKLSEAEIPNMKHVDPRWRNAKPEISDYVVPYVWGTTGIVYRRDLLKREIKSWLQFYRPEEDLRGKIVTIKDSAEIVGMALKALGYSMNSEDRGHYADARELLFAQKPYILEYSYVALNDESSLLTGKTWMAMVYNGDGLILQQKHPGIVFTIPREGTALWVDYLVVMDQSNNKKAAYQFINFLNRPENAARLAEYLMFATPNTEAKKHLSSEHLNNKMIYPNRAALENSEVETQLSPRIEKLRRTIFSEVIH